jgi:hypothetical protein
MGPSTSEAEQKKSWLKFKFTKKSEKVAPSPAKLTGRTKNPAAKVEHILVPQRPQELKGAPSDAVAPQSARQIKSTIEPETTWDRAVKSLRQRKPDLYTKFQDLRTVQGSSSSSDWLQRTLADCKETRDDAHARSRRNIEKVLRSVLVYKDVAIAVSRLDPHGIAPMVLTGVCVIAQVCSVSFNSHYFFFFF